MTVFPQKQKKAGELSTYADKFFRFKFQLVHIYKNILDHFNRAISIGYSRFSIKFTYLSKTITLQKTISPKHKPP